MLGPAGTTYLCQTEIENLGVTAFAHEDVRWLDIPVDDAFGVGGFERIRDFNSQFQKLFRGQRPTVYQVLQRLSVEKLHRNERLTVVFADFVDGADIWVVQSGSSLRLTIEAAQSLGVQRKAVRKELQGNEAV
jgi:hypothetical protein